MSLPPARRSSPSPGDALGLVIEQITDYAIFLLDPTGIIVSWNPGAQRIKGYRADEIIGQSMTRFYSDEDVRAGACERALSTARREGRYETEGWRVRKDGTKFWANVVITAVHDQGELVGFAKVTRDLTERRRAEQERLRLAEEAAARESAERAIAVLLKLQRLTASLAAALTPAEVAGILVNDGAEAMAATTAFVLLPLGDENLELVASRGAPQPLLDALARVRVDARIPAATAYRMRAPLWLEGADACARETADSFPGVSPAASIAALPLMVRGVVIAVMAFRFDAPRPFPPGERALMETFAVQAGLALDRAKIFANELAIRHRVGALGALAEGLSRALTTREVARVVVDVGTRAARADTCTLYSLDESTGVLELIGERGCSPEVVDRIRRIAPDSDRPVAQKLSVHESVWCETDEEYAAFDPSLAKMEATGPRARAFWGIPLVVEGRSIGLLGMGFYEPRRFSAEEREFTTTFTRQCAEALQRARRLETERDAWALTARLKASLATTLRSIGDAVIATDATGAIALMNEVAERLTGWREAEARGRPLESVLHLAGDPSPDTLVARDGRRIPIEDSSAPIRREDGASEGVVVVFRDVTEKKRVESRRAFVEEALTALAGSLDYEATLANVAGLIVPRLADWCAVDILPEGEVTPKRVAVAHVDPAKVRLANELDEKYPPKPGAPTGVPNVLKTGRSELYAEIPRELIVAGCVDEEHLRIALALELRSAMVVPLTARGRVLGAMTFVYAESNRRYTEEDLHFVEDLASRCAVAIDNARLYASELHARQSADIANRAKDEFLAVVSHELRTPLNAIMGWAKMITSEELDEERRDRAVEIIERNAVAMARLIEDLLDISRIISGKMRLEVAAVDLARVIDAAVESVRPAADAKGIRVTSVLDTTLPALVGDPTRLQQVVWNLLSNAVKFTPKGGRVEVILRTEDSWAEVTVRDTGKGIAPKFLSHVFDAFRQEDASSSRSRGGLGLGLAITRQLVELHGGRVEAHSEGEGQGASFVVRLPISAVARSAAPKSVRAPRKISDDARFERPPQLQGLRVLVVDDEEDARQLVKAILEHCGCRVRVAGNVLDAMSAIADDVPDVLVSDIGMPERDGYDLIRRVRELPPDRGGDVAAAALTAYARPEDRLRMLNAGYSMHVPKPVEPAELVAVVASLTRFAWKGARA